MLDKIVDFFHRLFTCKHNWEYICISFLTNNSTGESYTQKTYKCTKCGKVKNVRSNE